MLIGFLLGLAAHFTNPVPGPRAAAESGEQSVAAWKTAVDRLTVKRNWIIASFLVQMIAVGAIGYLAYEVF